MPIEIPGQNPCEVCEGIAGRLDRWVAIEEGELAISIIPDIQFEIGQSIVVPKRHCGILTDLTDEESAAVMHASQRLMAAIVAAYDPLGVLVFQNNGVFSGQTVPHYHLHVVPRQPGSDWGVGPPHHAKLDGVGRVPGTPHNPSNDEERVKRAYASLDARRAEAERIRTHLR